MLPQNVSEGEEVSVTDTLMLEGIGLPLGPQLGHTAIMEEVTMTDIQVTEGTPLGVTGAHCHAEELHQGTEVGGAGHHLYHAAHVTELNGIAEAVAQFAVVHLFDLVWRGAGPHPGAQVHHDPGLQWNHNLLHEK